MVVYAPVQNWLSLVSAIDKHCRRKPHIISTGELLSDLILALFTKDVHEGKFDVSFPKTLVELSRIPVWRKFLTDWARGHYVAYDPNVLVIIHYVSFECFKIQTLCPCPDAIVHFTRQRII